MSYEVKRLATSLNHFIFISRQMPLREITDVALDNSVP